MEINHEVTPIETFMDEKALCKKEEEPDNKGECRVGKNGNPGDLPDPTPELLFSNMKKAGSPIPGKPERVNGGAWDLTKCTPNAYPLQSHHLIPKLHLPKHDVCMWLAEKAGTKEYKLTASTKYDTDDARNGLSLPFASTTHQWIHKTMPEDKICEEMMFNTKKQLHQGQHTYTNYEGGEEAALHVKEESGYLGAVNKLLDVVHGRMLNHLKLCGHCKKDEKPIKVRPLERIVDSVHQVSQLMMSIINTHKQFVSKRAAAYFGKH